MGADNARVYLALGSNLGDRHGRLIEAVDHRLAEAGCASLGTCDVLLALRDAPDHRRRMHELADHVVLSRSGLTRLVDRLEAEGLLRRERCPNDRRGSYAALTDAGVQALATAWPVYASSVAELFGSALAADDAARLTTALDRATANAVDARHA